MRVFLSDRAKKCNGRVSNGFQQSHERSFFWRKRKKKKENLSRGIFFGLFWFVCIYLRSVIEPLLNEREGWTRKSGQVRSGLAGHAVPTYLTYLTCCLTFTCIYWVGGRAMTILEIHKYPTAAKQGYRIGDV